MIYEKKCPTCGTEFKTERKEQKFCCHKCSNEGRFLAERGNFDTSMEWVKHDGKWECPYQPFVGCSVRKCNKCDWNPEVAKARLEAYMNKGVTA